jgi:CHORD
MTKQLLCVNKSCGKYYDFGSEEDCYYHPGGPVFHDALKGWSCCSKKVTDFDQFLKIVGCSVGHHSNVKPIVAVEAVEEKVPELTDVVKTAPAKQLSSKEVFSASSEKKKVVEKTIPEADLNDAENAQITVGTKCKRPSCGKEFTTDESKREECIFHNGSPIFHEGIFDNVDLIYRFQGLDLLSTKSIRV